MQMQNKYKNQLFKEIKKKVKVQKEQIEEQ